MSAKFIKLTTSDETAYGGQQLRDTFVNVDRIARFNKPFSDKPPYGALVWIVGAERGQSVKETPEQILALIAEAEKAS